jgi:four helix bundle protein
MEMSDQKQADNLFNFEKLNVYQKALDYIDFVYMVSENFPKHELYGMTSQFRRAACSIALNTGEGAGSTTQDFNNFLRIAMRSIRECIVCTTISFRRSYITSQENDQSRNRLTELSKMTSSLMNSIKLKTSEKVLVGKESSH